MAKNTDREVLKRAAEGQPNLRRELDKIREFRQAFYEYLRATGRGKDEPRACRPLAAIYPRRPK